LCLDQKLKVNALPEAWIATCVLQNRDVLPPFACDFLSLLPAKRVHLLQPTP